MTDRYNVLFLTDLDDSLFSTLRKISAPEQEGRILAARASASAAAGKDSYMTSKQSALVEWMDLSRCVPVTARGTEAFSRVTLPFSGPATILTNGAVMLNSNGSVNENWAAVVNDVLRDLQETINDLSIILKELAKKRAMNIRSWAVIEPSCGAVYAVAKSNESQQGEGLSELLDDLRDHLLSTDSNALAAWQFHTNGNNLSVTPSGIGKAIAVKYLLRTLRSEQTLMTIGVGDSTSDLEFMRLCDMWMTPTQSQIDRLL